jgi:hypothetical protein
MEQGKEGTRRGIESQIYGGTAQQGATGSYGGASGMQPSSSMDQPKPQYFEQGPSYQQQAAQKTEFERGPTSYGRQEGGMFTPYRAASESVRERVRVTEAPTTFERVEKPPVVQERIKPVETEEIQPVIHRERELCEIREVLAPGPTERQVRPEFVEEKVLPPEYRQDVRLGGMPVREEYRPRVIVEPVEHKRVVCPAIIEEVVHKRVVEEVQPVLEREVVEPHLIKEKYDVYEKIIEPPVFHREYGGYKVGTTYETTKQASAPAMMYEGKQAASTAPPSFREPYIVEHSVCVRRA